jgi:hypothetical protein
MQSHRLSKDTFYGKAELFGSANLQRSGNRFSNARSGELQLCGARQPQFNGERLMMDFPNQERPLPSKPKS